MRVLMTTIAALCLAACSSESGDTPQEKVLIDPSLHAIAKRAALRAQAAASACMDAQAATPMYGDWLVACDNAHGNARDALRELESHIGSSPLNLAISNCESGLKGFSEALREWILDGTFKPEVVRMFKIKREMYGEQIASCNSDVNDAIAEIGVSRGEISAATTTEEIADHPNEQQPSREVNDTTLKVEDQPQEHSSSIDGDQAFSSASRTEAGGDIDRRGRCLLQIGVRKIIEGPCYFGMDPDGSFQVMSLQRDYFAYVNLQGEGTARGFWNGEAGASHAQAPLGTLQRKGACWENDTARVCAWS